MAAVDELTTLERGPGAVLEAVASDVDLNFDVLAQACGRRSRTSESTGERADWAEAGIACHERVAAALSEPFTKQGRLLSAHGLRATQVLTTGEATPLSSKYLDELDEWIRGGLQVFGEPAAFREALRKGDHGQHEHALLAAERLEIGATLRKAGFLSDDLDAWIAAVRPG